MIGFSRWTTEEVALLRKHYPTTMSIQEMIRIIGRDYWSIYRKARLLKLKRPKDGKLTKKDPRIHRPRKSPVGALRIDKGYLQRRVSATERPYWFYVHRLVWIEANGEVPDGKVVAFKTGMHTTVLEEITLDKLELVTRAEIMAKHSIHRYPPELVEVIRLRTALNRKIKEQEKK